MGAAPGYQTVLSVTLKAFFPFFGKILDDRGFHCFPTIPDFAEISGNRQTSVPDLRYSPVTDTGVGGGGGGEWGTGAKQFRGLVTS